MSEAKKGNEAQALNRAQAGKPPLVPVYGQDFRVFVNDIFDTPDLTGQGCDFERAPGYTGSIPDRVLRHWSQRDAAAQTLSYRPSGAVGSGEAVPLREMLCAFMETKGSPMSAFLTLAGADLDLSPEEQAETEAFLLDRLEEYQGLLVPTPVLALLGAAAEEGQGLSFLEEMERLRAEAFQPGIKIEDANQIRVQQRARCLWKGGCGEWTALQTSVAEFFSDYLFLAAIQWLDVQDSVRQVSKRKEASVAAVMEEKEKGGTLCFEKGLPLMLRTAPIVEALSTLPKPEDLERVHTFALTRPDHFRNGLLLSPQPKETRAPVATPRISSVQTEPGGVLADPKAEYREILDRLQQKVTGHEEAKRRLGLAVLLHRRGVSLQRFLLGGPTGVGKTHLARAVAESAGVPFFSFDVSSLVENGFSGPNLNEVMEAFYQVCGQNLEVMERSVLLLDEFDKIAVPPGAHGNAIGKHLGQQKCILTLLGGGTPVTMGQGSGFVRTERMLILCAGAFSRSDWASMTEEWSPRGWDGQGEPTAQDLIEYGFLPEIADRLKETIVLKPRSVDQMVEMFRQCEDGVEKSVAPMFQELGYTLNVPESTYRVMAARVASGKKEGYRWANGALVKAAKSLLSRALLEEGAHEGDVITLSPDDLGVFRG